MTIASVTGGDIIDPVWGNSVADAINELESGWVAYTPAWVAGLTVGSGSQSAEYRYLPGLSGLQFRGEFVFGAGSAISGIPRQTVPDSQSIRLIATAQYQIVGSVSVLDNSATVVFTGVSTIGPLPTDVLMFVISASSSHTALANMGATIPMTWSTGDKLNWDVVVPL